MPLPLRPPFLTTPGWTHIPVTKGEPVGTGEGLRDPVPAQGLNLFRQVGAFARQLWGPTYQWLM